jgi:hypothetical protein
VAFASDNHASCELAKKSILGRSSSGVPQVSNLGTIEIRCRVPQRPLPTKPGEFRNGLRAQTTAYEIRADGSSESVPSEVTVTGGGFGPGTEPEWVDFYVKIPLDSEQSEIEAREYFAKLERGMTSEQKRPYTEEVRKRAIEQLKELVSQHRTGHFQVECRVLDGTRVIGVDTLQLEVLYKGRFSEVGLPTSPPA